jgi:hypothetical protein
MKRRLKQRRLGASAAPPSFSDRNEGSVHPLRQVLAALRRAAAGRHRLAGKRVREDTRAWVVKRRQRTRHLIELGGLIAKAGLIDLTDDDRAVILGMLIEAADKLRGDERDQALTLWRRRGKRAFEANADVQ